MFSLFSIQLHKVLYTGIVVTFIFSMIGIAELPPASAQKAWTPTPNVVSLTPTPDVSPQIVGGQVADEGEWPWQVALVAGSATDLYQGQFCGGVLISSQWVLTAAHCIFDESTNPPTLFNEEDVDVVAGIWNLASPAPGYQRLDVLKIIPYLGYNFDTKDSDIALLQLASPVTIGHSGETKTGLIVNLHPPAAPHDHLSAWATGWGSLTGVGGAAPEELYEAKLTIIPHTECNNASHWDGDITNNMLCAGPVDGSRIGPCSGDSGGPLAIDFGSGVWYLIGISSFVKNNCDNNAQYPIVFTKVEKFAPWISAYVPPRQFVYVGKLLHGKYGLTKNQSTRVNYAVNSGPIQVSGKEPIIASMRVAYSPNNGTTWTSFSEMMGLPHQQVTRTYIFPWYNNVNLDSQLRIGNMSFGSTTVTVKVGGVIKGSYVLGPLESKRISYPGLDGGPVVVQASEAALVIASMRVAYHNGSAWTSFSEMMGLPGPQLTDRYVFPWYNNANLNSQLRFGNIGNANTTVTVTVGGVVKGNYALAPNQSTRVDYPGLDGGPVVIKSSGGVPIIASERVAYFNGSKWTSFSEMMGLPSQQLTDTYIFPWYNRVNLDSQLRFGNVGNTSTTVTVTVAGVVKGNYVLAPNQSTRVDYPGLDGGPVVIKSSGGVPIIASERVAYFNGSAWTNFSEMMGLPREQLSSTYDFPWYNNVDLDSQIRFGVP